MGTMQMNGREVFKFAVGTFQTLIAETLEKASLRAQDIDQFIDELQKLGHHFKRSELQPELFR